LSSRRLIQVFKDVPHLSIDVLNELYGVVTVPEAVQHELKQGYLQGEDVPHLEEYPWIKVVGVRLPQYLSLIADLGREESEVLAIAADNAAKRSNITRSPKNLFWRRNSWRKR